MKPTMSKEERERDAWAGFVFELRRHGYWGDPEKLRKYFEGFYDEYLESGRDNHAWEDAHCCDDLDVDGFVHERCWMFWTSEDKKKAKEEYERTKRGEGKGAER